MELPLVLVTNDDGIHSCGLWAAVEALVPLGQVLVVAPDRQWSAGGRSMPAEVTGRIEPASREISGEWITAFAVDASPALAVCHAMLELAPRRPALVVSGINFGANLGTDVTISGTVGAALEGGAFGIPSLAVSLEMDSAYHHISNVSTDYSAAMAFTQHFARHILTNGAAFDMDALNINIPADATPSTPWRMTRLSRARYFIPSPPDRARGKGRPGYKLMQEPWQAEPDSDIWALGLDRMVSVTPLSLDLTSRVKLDAVFGAALQAPRLSRHLLPDRMAAELNPAP